MTKRKPPGIPHGNRTHGMHGTKTYKVWDNMLMRCRNPKNDRFHLYGGRGISVCDRWNSFEVFLSDMGVVPDGYSIERKDVNGNYEPGNCVWLLTSKQGFNRRTTVRVMHEGREYALSELARACGVNPSTARHRVSRDGWDPLRAATELAK